MSELLREKIGKYLEIVEQPYGNRVTRLFVVNDRHGGCLGQVGWYAQWRQYVLEPNPNVVFSVDCLRDIAVFLQEMNAKHATELMRRRREEQTTSLLPEGRTS